MTTEEIRTALIKYKPLVCSTGIAPYKFASNAFVGDGPGQRQRVLQHIRWMIDQAIGFLDESERLHGLHNHEMLKLRDKAMRWLCFIQGTFWGMGYMTIDEMKADNKGPGAADTPTKEQ